MSPFRQIPLYAYLWATRRYRHGLVKKLAREGNVPVSILFYHRVADSHTNDWSIANRKFIRQMEWLKRHVDLVSLEEAQRRIAHGNERLCVSITFDDGYAENCDQALPYLIANDIPCTYFVALDFVLTGRPFPHDATAGQPLAPNTIDELKRFADQGIAIGGHTRNHPDLGRIHNVDILQDEVITASHELADAVSHPVNYFAFPFGQPDNLNPVAFEALRLAGMRGVMSAYGAYNLPGDDPFHLRRIHGDPEFVRFKNWVTMDPRKLMARKYESVRGAPNHLQAPENVS